MLRFGTAIARLRAHQLDAYEGGACKEANLARGRQPVPIVDVDRCLHEKAFIVWFMAEEIRSGDQPLRAATVLWFRPPPLNRDSIRSCEVEMAPRGIFIRVGDKMFFMQAPWSSPCPADCCRRSSLMAAAARRTHPGFALLGGSAQGGVRRMVRE
jgi:hypothetical protein